MTILGCQLDYIWNELQSRNGGYTWDPDLEVGRQQAFELNLEAGRHGLFDPDLEVGRHTFNLGHTFFWKPKDNRRREGLFFPCLPIPSLAL